jgi:uncharacterized protein YjbJ (UPF0337 family)
VDGRLDDRHAGETVRNRRRFCNRRGGPVATGSGASRTRVHYQGRTTTPVVGLSDGRRMGHLLGYARVSTSDQQPHLQIDALERAGCYRVFTETASGARTDQATLEQLLDQLRPGDTLVVWKLDLDLHRWLAGAGMAGFGVSHPGNPRRGPPANPEDGIMGADDKARNKAEELKGQAKEGIGRATDDEELEAEGRTDQAESDLKQAGEKVKDAFKR